MLLGWAMVGAAVFLIGLTKSGFGSGTGLMIVPITTLGMGRIPGYDAHAALALLLPLLIAGDLIALAQYRRILTFTVIWRLLPGTAAGVLAGSLLLGWFVHQEKALAEALINAEIGLESILLVSLNWYRQWRSKGGLPPYRPALWRSTLVGAFAGVSSTLAHAAGPIIALHLLPQKLDRRLYVASTALYFALLNISKLPAYYAAGLFAHTSPLFAMAFLPLAVLGAVAGFLLVRRISDEAFAHIVYLATFLLGCYLLAKGTWTLWGMWG